MAAVPCAAEATFPLPISSIKRSGTGLVAWQERLGWLASIWFPTREFLTVKK